MISFRWPTPDPIPKVLCRVGWSTEAKPASKGSRWFEKWQITSARTLRSSPRSDSMKATTATSSTVRDQASKTQTKSRSIEHQTIAKAPISITRTRKSKTSATRTCSTTLKITGKWLRLIQECSWTSNNTSTCNKIRPRSKTYINNENQLSTNQGHSKTASSNWGIFWTIINRPVHPRKYTRKWRSQSKQVKLQLLEVALKTEPRT